MNANPQIKSLELFFRTVTAYRYLRQNRNLASAQTVTATTLFERCYVGIVLGGDPLGDAGIG
jgi:hypothetical protein